MAQWACATCCLCLSFPRHSSNLFWLRSSNLLRPCSSGVPATTGIAPRHRHNKLLGGRQNKILGLPDTTLLHRFTGGDVGGGCPLASSGPANPEPHPLNRAITATHQLCYGFEGPTSTPKLSPKSTCRAYVSRPKWPPVAAQTPPEQVNTNTNTNNDTKDNEDKEKEGRLLVPVPSHTEGWAAHDGEVLGEVQEAKGKAQSLRGKV